MSCYLLKWGNVAVVACMLSMNAIASDMDALHAKRSQLNQLYVQLERINIGYTTKKVELEATESKIRRLKRDAQTERRTLDNLIKAQEKPSGSDYSEQIESQRQEWRKVNKLYLSQKEYVRILYDKVSDEKIQYEVTRQKVENLQHSINSLLDAAANTEIDRRLKDLKKSQIVRVETVEICSLPVTKDKCIEKARIRAERDAAEQGSLVVVDAVTEVKNFNLTKDEARSRVSARLSNINVFKKSYDLTADKTNWRVEYGFTATVTPAINEGMRNQLKQQTIATYIAGLNLQFLETRDLPEYVELPSDENTEYSSYIAPVVPVEIIPETKSQELLEDTEQEIQKIRDVAASKGAKKEAKEAKDELDSRRITIMVF